MDSLIPRGDLYREGSSQFLLNIEEKKTNTGRQSLYWVLTRTQVEITCDDIT